ncbi:putative L-cystine transmembrane transporter [Trypoxylus dichotomus]
MAHLLPFIAEQYSARYPQSVVPVLTNDIIFAIHGACITIITGIQCLIYKSDNQTVSTIVKCQHALIGAILVVTVALVNLDFIIWLDFIYVCSYVKLFLTLTKYVPQAYMNYRRKSTVGWNIYNVVADVTGGIFSISQMFLNAYNLDQWKSLIENPTKFWLGVVSILFDIIFIVQHYILYRGREEVISYKESILDEEKLFLENGEKLR